MGLQFQLADAFIQRCILHQVSPCYCSPSSYTVLPSARDQEWEDAVGAARDEESLLGLRKL